MYKPVLIILSPYKHVETGMDSTFQRMADLETRFRTKRSWIYDQITKSLLPKPIRKGPRLSLWPTGEIERIERAIIGGATDDDLRSLVARLHEERSDTSHKASEVVS